MLSCQSGALVPSFLGAVTLAPAGQVSPSTHAMLLAIPGFLAIPGRGLLARDQQERGDGKTAFNNERYIPAAPLPECPAGSSLKDPLTTAKVPGKIWEQTFENDC